jgi:hypothetical protein
MQFMLLRLEGTPKPLELLVKRQNLKFCPLNQLSGEADDAS